jgi:hypothetical protein
MQQVTRQRASSQPRIIGERGFSGQYDYAAADRTTADVRQEAVYRQSKISRETMTPNAANNAVTSHRQDVSSKFAAEPPRADRQNMTTGKLDCRPKPFTEAGATQFQKRRVVHVTEV